MLPLSMRKNGLYSTGERLNSATSLTMHSCQTAFMGIYTHICRVLDTNSRKYYAIQNLTFSNNVLSVTPTHPTPK